MDSKITVNVEVDNLDEVKELRRELERIKELKEQIEEDKEEETDGVTIPDDGTDPLDIPDPKPPRDPFNPDYPKFRRWYVEDDEQEFMLDVETEGRKVAETNLELDL